MGARSLTSGRSRDDQTESFHACCVPTSRPPPRAIDEARLVEVVGPRPGCKHLLDGGVVVGRSTRCDLVVDETEVSRRHCRVFEDDGRYVLEDLGSRNGTFVNGQRVAGRRELGFGDRIQVGRQTVLLLAHHDPLRDALLERQKMEALGQLGAGIAHDLNNLLGVLKSTLQYMDELGPSSRLGDPDIRGCHADLTAAVESAADMTRRLVGFARRSGSPEGATLEVSRACEEVVRLVRRTIPRSIRVETDLEPGLVVRGDATQVHQVLMNLCLNARDAMPDGGTLRIASSTLEATRVPDAPFSPGERLVHVQVADAGIGMDEATRERIFEPFFTTKSGPSGTGLGLSAVYEIVSSHGGHIAVDSAPGAGSVFHVYLPAAAGSSPDDRRERNSRLMQTAERNPRQGRVLLVDDQDLVRRAAGRLLRSAGHDVVVAGGGAEALERYTDAAPDVVILDLDMPEMSGDQCWQRLRRVDPEARVVFLTGSCDDARRRRLLAEGALGFLHKPVDAEILRDTVQRVLSMSGPSRAPATGTGSRRRSTGAARGRRRGTR